MMSTNKPNMPLKSQRKKLLFRSKHRGCKETDYILGAFVMEYINEFSKEELHTLEELLDIDDNTFYTWICNGYDGDNAKTKALIGRIYEFNQKQF